jgi:hypothetical protein
MPANEWPNSAVAVLTPVFGASEAQIWEPLPFGWRQ